MINLLSELHFLNCYFFIASQKNLLSQWLLLSHVAHQEDHDHFPKASVSADRFLHLFKVPLQTGRIDGATLHALELGLRSTPVQNKTLFFAS